MFGNKSPCCFRRWITWSPSLLTVTGGQSWPRNVWLRPRKRSALRLQQRWAHKDIIIPSFELIVAQVLYWLVGFVGHYLNLICSGSQAEKVHELNEEIGKLLAKAEQLGAEGNVDEAQKVLQEVEKVRTRKKDAEVSEGSSEETRGRNGCCSFRRSKCLFFWWFVPQEEYRNSMPASSFQQQKLRVCEVCSAYLGLHDNDRRLADHFGGKLHLGFIQIREKLDQLKVHCAASGRV